MVDTKVDDEVSLRQLVIRLARRSRRAWIAELEPFGLSPHLVRALSVVARSEPGTLRLSDLAARLRITPRSATEVVDSLVERDLVARAPSPSDRRATVLSLTDEGRRLTDEIDRARRARGDASFEVLSADERAALRDLLAKVVESGEEQDCGVCER